MATSSSKRHGRSGDTLQMSPEKAKRLFDNGGVLIVLNLPVGSVFGIDMKVYQVGDKFLGLKMIPPGLHFIYYSAVSKDGCIAPRTGFFHYFAPQEIVVKKWDCNNEDLNSVAPTGEEKQRIRENLQDLDRNLGAYPYQKLKEWNRLTCNISVLEKCLNFFLPKAYKPCGLKLRPKFFEPYQVTEVKPNERYNVVKVGQHDGAMKFRMKCRMTISGDILSGNFESLVQKLQPVSGVVSSVTQLVPLSYPAKESTEPDSTTEKRFQSLEDKYLPDMKKVPGTEIRFTEIPKNKYPAGCSAAQITMYNMDSTYVLEQLLESYDKEEDILGELQMAHVCFLIAHVYDAFEHWKNLVQVLCSVDSGLQKHTEILKTFLTIFHYQLKEIPSDFFVDITSDDNFLVSTLQIFFENVKSSNACETFKSFADKFRKNLTATFKWDFDGVPDDEQPVVVEF